MGGRWPAQPRGAAVVEATASGKGGSEGCQRLTTRTHRKATEEGVVDVKVTSQEAFYGGKSVNPGLEKGEEVRDAAGWRSVNAD